MSDYMLCYRKQYNLCWTCECGYETIDEVDKRAGELRGNHPHINTTFFPTYKCIPKPLKQIYAKYKLIPPIYIWNKPIKTTPTHPFE